MKIKEIREQLKNICMSLNLLITEIDFDEDTKRLYIAEDNLIKLDALRLPSKERAKLKLKQREQTK